MTRIEILSKMDWDGVHDWSKKCISEEIYSKVYERIPIKEGDIVFDLGATCGDWALCILEDYKPKHIYCIEPNPNYFEALIKNTKGLPITCINKAIGTTDDTAYCKLSTLAKLYRVEKIDFIKTDCEGGEYCLFLEDNLDYVLNNVKVIAGEWHLRGSPYEYAPHGTKEKFRWFRDNTLPKFYEFQMWDYSNQVNIKWDLPNEHFIDYYTEFFLTIRVVE